jgi:hypothetical protein
MASANSVRFVVEDFGPDPYGSANANTLARFDELQNTGRGAPGAIRWGREAKTVYDDLGALQQFPRPTAMLVPVDRPQALPSRRGSQPEVTKDLLAEYGL